MTEIYWFYFTNNNNRKKREYNIELSEYCKKLVIEKCMNRFHKTRDELIWSIGDHGKPFFIGNADINFNISHSENVGIIAISNEPIGIDIEFIKNVDFKIADRFFDERERIYILESNCSELEKKKRFFEIWTKKEAYIKWAGKGLSMRLNSFDVFSSNIASYFKTVYIDNFVITIFGKDVSYDLQYYKL